MPSQGRVLPESFGQVPDERSVSFRPGVSGLNFGSDADARAEGFSRVNDVLSKSEKLGTPPIPGVSSWLVGRQEKPRLSDGAICCRLNECGLGGSREYRYPVGDSAALGVAFSYSLGEFEFFHEGRCVYMPFSNQRFKSTLVP